MNENQKPKYGTFEEILSSFADPYGRTLCCAHRSYWRMYPENSVPSILAAIRKGCDCIELDVHVTRDGYCVLTHDATLARCTDAPPEIGNKKVEELDYEQIKDLHLRFATGGSSALVTDEKICTLEQAIKLCEGHIMINLDKVMEERYLRDNTYKELLRLTKLGYHPFEYCMFKLARFTSEEVYDWIREKKEQDGVDIIYVPWGPEGAKRMMDLGYKPPIFEFGFNIDEAVKLERKSQGVGYFANTFEGCGQDDERGWMRLIGMGANAIHTDEADWLPKVLRREFGEHYEIDGKRLLSYEGITGDMTLRSGIEAIGDSVFASDPDLRTMILTGEVKTVGAKAFCGCTNLTDLFLPANVTSIGADAFAECPVLTLHVASDSYGEKYAKENGVNYRVFEAYTDKFEFAFEENNLILKKCYIDAEDLVLPDTLLGHEIYEIGRNSLRGSSYRSVTFGKYVRMIEQHCLADCPNLVEVAFGPMVNAIAVTAFQNFKRDLIFRCKTGSYPFRYGKLIGVPRVDPGLMPSVEIEGILGTGTAEDPYILGCTEDIKIVGDKIELDPTGFYSNRYYKLVSDISLDTSEENNFPMLGRRGAFFTGDFNGNGHIIKGVRIKADEHGAGIFGYLINASVSDLTVEDAVVEAPFNVGVLCGISKISNFTNCHIVGSVAIATVQTGQQRQVGGFIGNSHNSRFVDCSVKDSKIFGTRDMGGFAGDLSDGSSAHRCCAEVEDFIATSNSNGGFVGNLRPGCKITSSYAIASATGDNNIGGFSGWSYPQTYIENCFAIGVPVSSTGKNTGGFTAMSVGRAKNCFYNEKAAPGSGEATPIAINTLNTKEFLDGFCSDFIPGENHPVIK